MSAILCIILKLTWDIDQGKSSSYIRNTSYISNRQHYAAVECLLVTNVEVHDLYVVAFVTVRFSLLLRNNEYASYSNVVICVTYDNWITVHFLQGFRLFLGQDLSDYLIYFFTFFHIALVRMLL